MKYRNIIWDWNGTLLDDLNECLSVLRELSRKFEMKMVDKDEYRDNFGFPVSNFYIKYGFDPKKYSFAETARIFSELYEKLRPSCPLQSGAMETLRALSCENARQSIVSAYEDSKLKDSVRERGIEKYFEKISGLSDNTASSKVKLAISHAKSLGADPKETVVIGDTLHDSESAEAIGASCVLISCGHQSEKVLKKSGRKIFKGHSELLKFLLSD